MRVSLPISTIGRRPSWPRWATSTRPRALPRRSTKSAEITPWPTRPRMPSVPKYLRLPIKPPPAPADGPASPAGRTGGRAFRGGRRSGQWHRAPAGTPSAGNLPEASHARSARLRAGRQSRSAPAARRW
ncbi:hypothetical protein G6F24_017770 [Rhizopus arrhizus]|nr:hypothetical protein G6F24_017770 [Rhizopus arrhizus]